MKITDETVTLAMSAYSSVDGGLTLFPDAMRTALEAALSAQPQTVAVKPLEWKEIDLRVGTPPVVVWEAKTPFMNYTLESVMERPWFCHFICAHFKDLQEAKAAAQADYEARIRSAFTAAPAQELCEDEGCPNHGIPHVCINRVAQEPVAIYRGNSLIDCGDKGHHNIEMLRLIPANTPLYLTPPDQSARSAELEKENAALAAWACVHSDGSGVTGDDRGNAVCMKDARIAELEAVVEALLASRAITNVGEELRQAVILKAEMRARAALKGKGE